MAQARRIKPKKAKKTKKARKPLNLPWGLMTIILVSGVVLGMLLSGAQNEGSQFGAGLKELFTKSEPPEDSDEAIAALIKNDSEKSYDFYEMLKDDEQFMPEDLPDSQPARPDANLDFYLQAASFLNPKDAEKLRARLALKGYRSMTQVRTNDENVTYYRVRLGPYEDKRKAKTAKNKLQKLGVKPFMYSVKK